MNNSNGYDSEDVQRIAEEAVNNVIGSEQIEHVLRAYDRVYNCWELFNLTS